MRRGVLLVAAAVAAVAVAASAAQSALFFLFAPSATNAGEVVSVRLGGTPADFREEDRQRPFRKGIRLYLAPSDVAGEAGSRFDRRLHFVGRIIPDRRSRGLVRFRVPPLDSGAYSVAAWCPECARFSFGNRFFVQQGRRLRITLPDPARSCPVTKGRNDNGFLSVDMDDGVLSRPRQPDGSFFDKLGWQPRKGFTGTLTVRGERLDAPGLVRVLSVNWGYATVRGQEPIGSWRSAVEFPDEGCYRLTGRVGDIALSYVVRVVASS
jgi:hypothetical protein